MNFSDALTAMKAGSVVRRKSWSLHVLFASRNEWGPILRHKRTDGTVYSDPWRPMSYDMFAEDWEIVT